MEESAFFEELFDKLSKDFQEEDAIEFFLNYFIQIHQLTGNPSTPITEKEWQNLENLLINEDIANRLIAIDLLKGFQLAQKELIMNLSRCYKEAFARVFDDFSRFFNYIDRRTWIDINCMKRENELEELTQKLTEIRSDKLSIKARISNLRNKNKIK